MRNAIVPCLALLSLTCRSHDQPPPAHAPAIVHTQPRGPAVDAALLRDLAVLATSHQPSAADLAETRHRIESGQLSIEGYVDALLARPEFATDVAPLVVLRHLLSEDALATPSILVLQHTNDTDPIYYLGDKVCAANQIERVHPWWNLDHEVRVCGSAYRPAAWISRNKKGTQETSCLAPIVVFRGGDLGGCGCGPNLFRCYTSAEQVTEVAASLRDELRRTVAHIAATDLPIETIFTSNETFRDRNAEQVRRVHIIEATREAHPEALLRDLATWPTEGKWAPRRDQAPGHQAGILTAAKITFDMPDRRQRMAVIYDVLWCMEADSVGATPEKLLALKSPDLQLQSSGWHELAARPICTNCHARLDYGMQFFFGYPNANFQPYFMPALQQSGRGPLYAKNIEDPRGEAELNPHGFSELAVAQPEFRRCIARDFGDYALGNVVTPEHIDAIEHAIRPNATTLRDVMRDAMLALIRDWPEREHAPAAATSNVAASTGAISISPALHDLLDTYCLDCHTKEPDRPDLAAPTLAREVVIGMIDEVAFARMPKDHPLPATDRSAFLAAFIAATWSGDSADTARKFFIGRMAAAPAFRPEVILSLVHAGSTAKSPPWRMMENAVRSNHQQVTPGLIGIGGLAAVEACRERYTQREDIDRCIDELVKLDNLTLDLR